MLAVVRSNKNMKKNFEKENGDGKGRVSGREALP
jgi:hypothetical protein